MYVRTNFLAVPIRTYILAVSIRTNLLGVPIRTNLLLYTASTAPLAGIALRTGQNKYFSNGVVTNC